MQVQNLVTKVKKALDRRESFDCDSQQFEDADQAINKLLLHLATPEDIEEFNRIFNKTNYAGK